MGTRIKITRLFTWYDSGLIKKDGWLDIDTGAIEGCSFDKWKEDELNDICTSSIVEVDLHDTQPVTFRLRKDEDVAHRDHIEMVLTEISLLEMASCNGHGHRG